MTHEEQITMSNEMLEVHVAMDSASALLGYIIDEDFCGATAPDYFEYNYERIQIKLCAVAEFLYKACLRMDFIVGEKTSITEAFKSNVAELMSYHMPLEEHKK